MILNAAEADLKQDALRIHDEGPERRGVIGRHRHGGMEHQHRHGGMRHQHQPEQYCACVCSPAMPLTLAPPGVKQSIKRIQGREDVRHFLQTLGFVVGESVSVVAEMSGNVIVNVKDTRIAIDKSMANKIIV